MISLDLRSKPTPEDRPAPPAAPNATAETAAANKSTAFSGLNPQTAGSASSASPTQVAGNTAEPTPPTRDTAPIATPADLPELARDLQAALGDRWRVGAPLAIGGMAAIFQVESTRHGGTLVAKVLHRAWLARPDLVAAFKTEARHSACVGGHPNAVPVFDLLQSSSLCCLLLSFIEGEDLDRLLERSGPLSRDAALHCAAQISSLLAHAESLGIVHGDLSPGNIRLDLFGRYRVLDFGLSRSGDRHSPAPRGGTPRYQSPEQARGEPLTTQSDLFSLGLVLAEMLTATPLLPGDTTAALDEQRTRAAALLPASITADAVLDRLLRSLLAPDPVHRMRSAFELSGALAALGFERPELSGREHHPRGVRSTPRPSGRSRLS